MVMLAFVYGVYMLRRRERCQFERTRTNLLRKLMNDTGLKLPPISEPIIILENVKNWKRDSTLK